ncbi:MAG: biotin/lipoyl-containing protein, partial [Betaproteobacteria bacterium]
MLVEVKVPQLSESVSEATLVSWHKKEGEFVNRDENLIDIETDKVVLETPAPESGVLKSIKKPSGASVTSNELIAVIDTEAKAAAGAAPATGAASAKPAAMPAPTTAAPPPSAAPAVVSTAPAPAVAASAALPAARKLMADKGIAPDSVEGTGRGGRITKGDVMAVAGTAAKAPVAPVATPAASSPPKPAPAAGIPADLTGRPEQRVPMSRLRQRVAERLVQSQSTAAILTTFNEVNMQPVIDLRTRSKDRFEKEHGV